MAETESEVASTSGFKVRPLSKRESGAKRELGAGSPESDDGRQVAEGRGQQEQSKVQKAKPPEAEHSSNSKSSSSKTQRPRLYQLTAELRELEAKLRLGGGADRIKKQHQQGKLTARE